MRISQYLKHDQKVKNKAPFVKSHTNTAVQFNYCTMKLKRTANNSITRIHIWRFCQEHSYDDPYSLGTFFTLWSRTLIRWTLQFAKFF